MTNRVRALASKLVAEVSPGGQLSKVLFTLGGADANENAIKLARGCTGRFKILARYRSYHGASAGAMAATGDPRRVAWEPMLMPGIVHFLDPYRYRSTFHRTNPDVAESEFTLDYLNHLEEIIQYEGPETIAAILIESVTGTNGIIIPPDGYLQSLRALCDKYGILLIADEVMSGFGRTGKWFAVDNWNVVPDIITMAKGINSGYVPLGAMAIREPLAAWVRDKYFAGGLTYSGHPLACALGVASIEAFR
jgi:taurine--2-oxoglutarate transaminase